MKNESLSAKLNKPRRPLRTALVIAAAAVVIAGAGVGTAVAAPLVLPQPTSTSTYVVPHTASCDTYRGGICYTPDMQAAADQQQQQLADAQAAAEKADAAAKKAAAEKAARQEAQQPDTSGLLPSGAVPPMVHVNGAPDAPDSTACASSSVTSDGHGGFVCY